MYLTSQWGEAVVGCIAIQQSSFFNKETFTAAVMVYFQIEPNYTMLTRHNYISLMLCGHGSKTWLDAYSLHQVICFCKSIEREL